MRAIAKEEPLLNPLKKDFIQKQNLGAASSVNTALKTLEQKEIVIRDDHGGYLMHEVMPARWLQQR